MLFMSFMTSPVPTPPQCEISVPMQRRYGSMRASTSALAPTVIARVPSSADGTPRAIGASAKSAPLAANAAAASRLTATVAVVMSTMVCPARACSTRPPAPKHTSRTCDSPGTHRNTMSARAATSATLAPASIPTPAPVHSATRAGTMSYPSTGFPDLRARLRHIRPPITPRPMKPRVAGSFIATLQHCRSRASLASPGPRRRPGGGLIDRPSTGAGRR